MTLPPAEVFSAAGATSAMAPALVARSGAGAGAAGAAGRAAGGAAAPGAAEALGELVVHALAKIASQTRYVVIAVLVRL
jgi:hypothetical protein